MPTYCGNNLNYSGLLTGTHVLGTNYECMRKGIGVGSHMPYDSAYSGPYAPVDPRRFYCGNNPFVPPGYMGAGSPSKCLQIGIGVGKSQRAAMGPPFGMYFIRYVLPYILFFLTISGIFVILYVVKPKFVTKKDLKNKIIIDWSKLVPYFIIACLLIAIIIWWFWYRFVRSWI